MSTQSYPWLKLPHRQYLVSITYAALKPVERLAFLELAMYAHTQADNQLPDNDLALAGWADMSIKQWLKVKANVFSEWLLKDGFWSLPEWFVVESAPTATASNDNEDNATPRQQRNADRQKRYRERNANRNAVTPENVTRYTDSVTQDVTRNATVTGSNVTHRNEMGGRGEDLDSELNQDLDLNQEVKKPLSQNASAKKITHPERFFDDELRPDLKVLNAKLGADLINQKFIEENLFSFNARYETQQLTDNQRLAKWISWWRGEEAKKQTQAIKRQPKEKVFGNVNDDFPIVNHRLLTPEEIAATKESLNDLPF